MVATSASIAFAIGTLVPPTLFAARYTVLDYLDAPRISRSPYDHEVTDHFFVTPFDCGRYFEDTNFSISVYLTKAGDKAIASSVASSQDLLDVPAAKHNRIVYTRHDREIPKPTALMLRSVWRLMLDRKFLSKKEKDSLHVAVLDDFTGQFSLQLANGRMLRGDLPVGSRFWGLHVRRFWDLANLIYQYCAADDYQKRATLRKQIKKDATMLIASLKKGE